MALVRLLLTLFALAALVIVAAAPAASADDEARSLGRLEVGLGEVALAGGRVADGLRLFARAETTRPSEHTYPARLAERLLELPGKFVSRL